VTDYFTDENIKFKVETKNYNDQILKKSYTAKLSKLSPQERVFRTNFESEIQKPKINPQAIKKLQTMNWSGNVRELKNITERLAILCEGEITEKDIEKYS
jgi:transcriptional regulator of aromatic amino acid metabolism